MSEIPEEHKKQKPRAVYQVAKELKVITPTIIEFLEARGYNVSRKQMHPVSDEMYVELLHKFDRAKYLKYQSEHSTTREAVQKRDSKRFRKEEKEKLLAVKKETPESKQNKKIELPRKKTLKIVKPAPKEKSKPKEEKQTKTEDSKIKPVSPKAKEVTKPTSKAVISEEVDKKEKAIIKPEAVPEEKKETRKRSRRRSAAARRRRRKEKAALEARKEIKSKVEAKQEKIESKTEDAEKERKVITPHKIELPQPIALKIIKQAPDKAEEKIKKTKKEIGEAISKKDKGDIEKKTVDEKIVTEAKPKKRRLKRKRTVIKVESIEDTVETEHEDKIRTELKKQSSSKLSGKKEETHAKPSRKRRRRKSKTKVDPVITPERSKKTRKRTKISATEVAATIKETMAKMDGPAKKHKRHAHSAGSESLTEEEIKLIVSEFITTQELADIMDISYQDLIQRCLGMGMLISINQRLDRDTIELLAAEYDLEVEFVMDEEIENIPVEEVGENLVKRPPVVTVMGHVDHGKTTLLDHLRHSRVAEGEVGGITQHIGAYEVVFEDQRITFLDTPGHEAFTAMRARGAQLTDIVVLVVAADDRVMPQTLEAIDHARAANTVIIVAVNKIDKPEANVDAIYKQLSDHNVLVEEWGGKYQTAEISAKFGQGVDDLLAEIIVASDMLELKADSTIRAHGIVVESRLDKGLGAVATILIKSGTLNLHDPIVVGESYGRVRAMYNEYNERRDTAGPSTPVQVVGFNGVPQAGDHMVVYKTEKEVREISQRRQRQHRELSAHKIRSLSLEQASKQLQESKLKELPLIIKGDVHGSVEVLADALMKLSTSEVKVEIIHRGVGGITESDILLAAASNAIIIGFHVHPNVQARELARKEGVEIRLYRIIHEVVDEIRASLEGLLAPLKEEQIIGSLEVRQVFKISRLGSIAGSYVLDGKITRNSKVRLIRDDVEVWSGFLASLKRFKDDSREVATGFECGIALEGYRDIREGDRIEAYNIIETKRKLDAPA